MLLARFDELLTLRCCLPLLRVTLIADATARRLSSPDAIRSICYAPRYAIADITLGWLMFRCRHTPRCRLPRACRYRRGAFRQRDKIYIT